MMAALLLGLGSCRNSAPAEIGKTAPDFTVTDDQRTVQLSQFRGKPVLLNFWATWCPPCVQEVPDLVALQQQMGDKVVVLAVSMDVDEGAYKSFTAKRMPGLLTVRDPDHKSSTLYGTFAYPETFLIDKDGKIQRKFIGAVAWTSPEMIEYFKKL
jgi:peroxiredoxin